MFTVWPELFVFEFIAIALLRIVVGFLFMQLGVRWVQMQLHEPKTNKLVHTLGYLFGGAQFVVGGFILVGLFTQPAAIIAVLSLFMHPKSPHHKSVCDGQLELLLLATTLSLLCLGAGAFAFDMPF